MKHFFLRILLLSLPLFFTACAPERPETEIFQQTLFAFDTVLTITVTGASVSRERFDLLMRGIRERIDRYDCIYNAYNPQSETYRIRNMKTGRLYCLSDELYGLLKRCRNYHSWTKGAFDITIGRISRLYRFTSGVIPGPEEIRTNLKYTGIDNLILTNRHIGIRKAGIMLDLGGVAKGTIVDRLSGFILKQGITNFIVNIGGDLYASGKNSRGKNWEIGIQHPRVPGGIIRKIKVSGRAVVTSGDYERYFIRGKKRYHHILDPRTGLPVQSGVMSVTVTAPDAETADYIATALFVLGRKKGTEFVKKRYGSRVTAIIY